MLTLTRNLYKVLWDEFSSVVVGCLSVSLCQVVGRVLEQTRCKCVVEYGVRLLFVSSPNSQNLLFNLSQGSPCSWVSTFWLPPNFFPFFLLLWWWVWNNKAWFPPPPGLLQWFLHPCQPGRRHGGDSRKDIGGAVTACLSLALAIAKYLTIPHLELLGMWGSPRLNKGPALPLMFNHPPEQICIEEECFIMLFIHSLLTMVKRCQHYIFTNSFCAMKVCYNLKVCVLPLPETNQFHF